MNYRYIPSNQVNPFSLILFFLLETLIVGFCSGLVAMVGRWLYAPYAGMVLVIILSACSYWVYWFGIRWSHSRNLLVTRITVLLSSLLVAYYHMCTVVSTTRVLAFESAAANPSVYFDNIGELIYASVYQMSEPGYVFSGFLSNGVPWIIYLFFIIFFTAFFPQAAAKVCSTPYSETEKKWMTKVYSVGKLEPIQPNSILTLEKTFSEGNLEEILRYPKCTRNLPAKYAEIVFYKVDDANTGYVSIENVSHLKLKGSERDPDAMRRKEVVPPYLLGKEKADRLEQLINSTAAMMNFPENNPFLLKKM